MRTTRPRGTWDTLEKHNERIARLDLQLELFVKRFDQSEASWKEERREIEARIAADRKETAERLAAERKEASERLEFERKEFLQERKEAKKEFDSQKRWLKANFIVVLLGIIGFYAAYFFL